MTETIFDLRINLANDAMQTPGDVAYALRSLAAGLDTMEYGDVWYDTSGIIRDTNGNAVGDWKVDAYSR